MTTSLATSWRLTAGATFTGSTALQQTKYKPLIDYSLALTDGTGANQANEVWANEYTTNSAQTIDLYGSLTDAFGTTLNFVKIKGIFLYVVTVTTGYTITIGNAASNPFVAWAAGTTPRVVVGPGGFFGITSPVDGYTVTNSSADQLKMDPGSNTVNWQVMLIGTV